MLCPPQPKTGGSGGQRLPAKSKKFEISKHFEKTNTNIFQHYLVLTLVLFFPECPFCGFGHRWFDRRVCGDARSEFKDFDRLCRPAFTKFKTYSFDRLWLMDCQSKIDGPKKQKTFFLFHLFEKFWLGGAAPQTPRVLAGGAKPPQTPPKRSFVTFDRGGQTGPPRSNDFFFCAAS